MTAVLTDLHLVAPVTKYVEELFTWEEGRSGADSVTGALVTNSQNVKHYFSVGEGAQIC